MNGAYRWSVALTLGALLWLAMPLEPALAGSQCDPDGSQASGAVYRFCMPDPGTWNGDLVLYAHGYVAAQEPIAIPEDQLSVGEGPSLPEIVNGLNYAFATTSYSTNGLAVKEGIADLLDLIALFSDAYGTPHRVYLTGPSEGGIITALSMERHPDVYDGAISACGPVGNFAAQVNYWGDARVLFDYFFPGLLPGSPIEVPAEVQEQWETVYEPRVRDALAGQPIKRQQWLKTARIPEDPDDLEATIDSLVTLLWYNIFATNDGVSKLGGQPFENQNRVYRGSLNDRALNEGVARFSADPVALQEMAGLYQTTGALTRPMVMIHTVDPIIPGWHQLIYAYRVRQQQRQDLHTYLPFVGRYGHCQFTAPQLLVSFVIMVWQASGDLSAGAEGVLYTETQRQEYRALLQQYMTEADAPSALYLPLIRWGALGP